jgi:hypothetical protein
VRERERKREIERERERERESERESPNQDVVVSSSSLFCSTRRRNGELRKMMCAMSRHAAAAELGSRVGGRSRRKNFIAASDGRNDMQEIKRKCMYV